MKIITVPHPVLRQQIPELNLSSITPELEKTVAGLSSTLARTVNPRGVGLAAPQVNLATRAFATHLSTDHSDRETELELRVYLNPQIIDHSDERSFGPDKKHPTLEGCLSIPGFYGPVPRWPWIKLRFWELENGEIVEKTTELSDFAARVVQHEYDHLEGILFTDYSLQFELPVYKENPKTSELEELADYGVLALF